MTALTSMLRELMLEADQSEFETGRAPNFVVGGE
jgi:hypothetical protein